MRTKRSKQGKSVYNAFKLKIENVRVYRDIYEISNISQKSKRKMQGIKLQKKENVRVYIEAQKCKV